MGGIILGLIIGGLVLVLFSAYAFNSNRKLLRRAKGIERGLKMVPILIHLPPMTDQKEDTSRDAREVMREKVSQAESLYDLIVGTATSGFKSKFYGQRHLAFEMIASGGKSIYYYVAVPVALQSAVQQAILTAYPQAQLEEVEDHNIFNPTALLPGTAGGELVLKQEASFPIMTFENLERDPMEAIINAMSQLGPGEGAAIQILLRPAGSGWLKRAKELAKKKRFKGSSNLDFSAGELVKAAVKAPKPIKNEYGQLIDKQLTGIEQNEVEAVEAKTQHPGYEVLIRVLASAATPARAQGVVSDVVSTFALFDAPGLNGFKYVPAGDMAGLVTAFIFRFFPPELNHDILNSRELATLFHLPQPLATPVAAVERQQSKQVDGPAALPESGLLLGYNQFRGAKKPVRLTTGDRRRHTYVVGQTGTGKSTLLENLAVQDMQTGSGFAFIDPHGDVAERLMSMVPKERAEDVIYFNPGDTEYPLGLNLFEFTDASQKDFLIQEAISMLYKLYDPGHTGIIGPRFEQWFRNAALTLMADPAGGTFIEIPKLFTDADFLKSKFKHLKDPTVIDFWTKEMGQTSDYHKSEMLGYFSSKFGAFAQNEILRNIIGQPKSAFNLRDIMDNKKILLVNLSKGKVGELNSQLLGMIFVIKFQAAAMARAEMSEDQRQDFCLYVDEFQNFSTDSFASILSEARKYRLNLIVANQFIGQLSEEIREAVFGNVGTIVSFRCGPEDADFLTKQFTPVFDAHDLVNLSNGNAVIRLMMNSVPSQPFSMETLMPQGQPHAELALAVKQLSAAKFGRPRQVVEKEIFARMSSGPQTALPKQPSAAVPATSEPSAYAVQTTPPKPQLPPTTPAAGIATEPNPAPTATVANSSAGGGSLSVAEITKDMPLNPAPASEQTPTVVDIPQQQPNTSNDQPLASSKPVVDSMKDEIKTEGLDKLISFVEPATPAEPASQVASAPIAAAPEPIAPASPVASLPSAVIPDVAAIVSAPASPQPMAVTPPPAAAVIAPTVPPQDFQPPAPPPAALDPVAQAMKAVGLQPTPTTSQAVVQASSELGADVVLPEGFALPPDMSSSVVPPASYASPVPSNLTPVGQPTSVAAISTGVAGDINVDASGNVTVG